MKICVTFFLEYNFNKYYIISDFEYGFNRLTTEFDSNLEQMLTLLCSNQA